MLNNDENDAAFLAELGIERTQFKEPAQIRQPTPTPVSVREIQVHSIPGVEGYWVHYEDALQLSQDTWQLSDQARTAERRRQKAEHGRREALRQAEENRRYMRLALAVAGFWLLFAGYMAVRG